MNPITQITGRCIPLPMAHINTDLIIPAKYLKSTERLGYGSHLFQELRESLSEFPLNLNKYRNSDVLITLENFGCGSSREHAVWALVQYGIKAILAPSFSDIFYNNSLKNRLPLIQLPSEEIVKLIDLSIKLDLKLEIDLENKLIISDSIKTISFDMDNYTQYQLIHGVDELDYLLSHLNIIKNYFINNPTSLNRMPHE